MRVPETAMNEYRKSGFFEEKVRLAWQVGGVLRKLQFQGAQQSFALPLGTRPS
ncbi:MAG TPA: hypothetical protein VNX26_14640 [Candidatus Acidoferrum sp.]|nr:hypothetical protein [Candidatus Acidoferrum sp.]